MVKAALQRLDTKSCAVIKHIFKLFLVHFFPLFEQATGQKMNVYFKGGKHVQP